MKKRTPHSAYRNFVFLWKMRFFDFRKSYVDSSKQKFSWQKRCSAFSLAFLMFFTSAPVYLLDGGFFNFASTAAFAEETQTREGEREGRRTERRNRGGRYRPAPADFYFCETSDSEFAGLELVEISTDSNLYYNVETGEETEEFFAAPIRFEGECGNLVEIDPSLVESEKQDYAYESNAGESTNFFPETIDEKTPFLLTYADYEIRFTVLADEDPTLKEIEDLEFTNPFSETEERPLAALYTIDEDMSFRVTSSDIGIKSEFILYELPETNIFTYELELTNLQAYLSKETTSVLLFCASEETTITPVAVIPEGLMWDSTYCEEYRQYFRDIAYELERIEEGRYKLTLIVCEYYLNCPTRVFPITVDPTITWQGTFASSPSGRGFTTGFVRSGSPTRAFDSRLTMPVGRNANGIGRSFLRGDNLEVTIRGRSVTAATLHLRQMNVAGHDRNVNVAVHRQLCAVGSQVNTYGSMTWNNQPGHATPAIVTQQLSTASWTYSFNVLSWAQGVANGDFRGRGLVLRPVNETTNRIMEFYGSSDTHGTRRPRIVITTVNPPTAPTSVTLSNATWAPGMPLPLLRWSGHSSTRAISRFEYRIVNAVICHTAGSHSSGTVVKAFETAPFLTEAQSTAGFALPISNLPHGCYRIAVRVRDNTGAVSGAGHVSLHVDRVAPTFTASLTAASSTSLGGVTFHPHLNPAGITWWNLTDTPWCNANRITLEAFVRRPNNTTSQPQVIINNQFLPRTGSSGSIILECSHFIPGHTTNHTVVLRARDRAGHIREVSFPYFYNSSVPQVGTVGVYPQPNRYGWFNTNDFPQISWSEFTEPAATAQSLRRLYVGISTARTTLPTNFVPLTSLSQAQQGTTALPSSITNTPLADGRYYIHIRPKNQHGNAGASRAIPYYIDTTAPVLGLALASQTSGNIVATSTENNTLATAPEVSGGLRLDILIDEYRGASGFDPLNSQILIEGVTVAHISRIYGNSLPSTNDNRTLNTRMLSGNGIYRATFTGQDRAGNIAESATMYFEVQNLNAAPSITCVFGSRNPVSNTGEFLLSWNFVTGGALSRQGIEWTVVKDSVDIDDCTFLDSLEWTQINEVANRGSFGATTPRDSQGNVLTGTFILFVRAVDSDGRAGRVGTLTLEVDTTGPNVQISGFEAGIVKGSVTSERLLKYQICIKEKGQSESAFVLVYTGDSQIHNCSVGFVDVAGNFSPNRTYVLRLSATDRAGNVSYDTFEVFSALDASMRDFPFGLFTEPYMSRDSRRVPHIVTSEQTRFGICFIPARLDWYVSSRYFASADSDISFFSADFSNSSLFPEASYQTIFGTTATRSQWAQKGQAPTTTAELEVMTSGFLPFSTAQDFKSYFGGYFKSPSTFLIEEDVATLTTSRLTLATPFRDIRLELGQSLSQLLDKNLSIYISVDGKDWEDITPRANANPRWYVAADRESIYATSLQLQFVIEEGVGRTIDLNNAVTVLPSIVMPEVFTIDFLSNTTPVNFSARDRLDYRTHFYWTSASDRPSDVTYEVLYSTNPTLPTPLWTTLATGLDTNTFASPNFNYSQDLYYKVVPVRARRVDGEVVSKRVGTPSNIATSRAADENEFSKRLGVQCYWAYQTIETPVGNSQIELSQGNLVYSMVDRYLENDAMLQCGITRIHNSQSSLIFSFGQGTDFSYNVELLRQQSGQSYVFKDATGTLRTFVWSDFHEVYFTRDSMRIRMERFDYPKQVRVRTNFGSGNTAHKYENLLVGYIVTSHRQREYWFNQGGQLVYITDTPKQLHADLAQGQSYHIANHDVPNLTFTYCSDTGLLRSATSRGIRSMHFAHNEQRLVSAVWLPDESVISYHYDNKRLIEVRQHENLVSEADFLAGTLPNNHADDIYHTYTWTPLGFVESALSFLGIGQQRYFKTGINGIPRTVGAETPTATITYTRDRNDEMMVRATSATTVLGDRTDITYNIGSATSPLTITYAENTPYGLNTPTTATRSTLCSLGHPIFTKVGTVEDVANGDAQNTAKVWQNHLLTSTTTVAEYHTLAADGTVIVNRTPRVTTTGYNALQLPEVTIECSGITVIKEYNETGTNEELYTRHLSYCPDGYLEFDEYFDYDEYGNDVWNACAVEEEVTIRDYYPNGNMRSILTGMQTFEYVGDKRVPVGNIVPQHRVVFSYDRQGNQIREVSTEYGNASLGTPNVVTFRESSFDGLGRLLSSRQGTYTPAGVAEATTVQNVFDRQGRHIRTTTTLPNGETLTSQTDFNRDGTVALQIDEQGTESSFIYDSAGRTLSATTNAPDRAAQTATTEYGFATIELNTPEGTRTYKSAQVTITTDSAGLSTRTYTDALGRTIRTNFAGINTDTAFTSCGRPFASIVLPESLERSEARITLTLFDENGNEIHQIDRPEFSAGSFRVAYSSKVSSQVFNAAGRVVQSIDALGNVTDFTYAEGGTLASIALPESYHILPDSLNTTRARATAQFVDEEIVEGGKVSSVIDPLGRLSQTRKDASGRVLSITDFGQAEAQTGVGITQTFTYNEQGQLTRQTFTNGDHLLFFYDASGNQTRTEWRRADNALEQSQVKEYDRQNRLVAITDYRHVGNTQEIIYHQRFTYDIAGRRTASFEGHTRPANITADMKSHYVFDTSGRLTERRYPATSEITSNHNVVTAQLYTFDEHGRLYTIKVRVNGQEQILREYFYDAWGRVVETRTRTNFAYSDTVYIAKRYTYTDFGQVESMKYFRSTDSSTPIESFIYTYDKNGQILTEHHISNLVDPPHDEKRTYTYNENGRLIRSESTLHGVVEYGFDKVGNRRAVTTNGEQEISYYTGLDQILRKSSSAGTAIFTHCENGNLISEVSPTQARLFSYSVDNRLIEVRQGTTQANASVIQANAFRGDGQRITKVEDAQTTNYTYRAGQVIYTTDEHGNRRAFNIYSPAGNIIAARQYCSSSNHQGEHVTYLADIRGSITSIIDDNMNFIQGYRYTDYGITTRIGSGAFNEFAYTQGIWDELTGLYYLNARFYNPVDGRFLTQDPYRGSNDQPDTWHLYGYCVGDPVNWVDPTGHRRRALGVQLRGQEQDRWCVAASLQMILRFVRPGNIRSQANLQYDLVQHRRNRGVHRRYFVAGARRNDVNARLRNRALGWRAVRNNIGAGRPIVVRIAWNDGGGHFAVIQGYDRTQNRHGPNRRHILINDPAPPNRGQRWEVLHTNFINYAYSRDGGRRRGSWTHSFDRIWRIWR